MQPALLPELPYKLPSQRRSGPLLAVSAAMVALGVWGQSALPGHFWWVLALLFAWLAVEAAGELMFGRAYLLLRQDGFLLRGPFGGRFFPWAQVTHFRVAALTLGIGWRAKRVVGWDYMPGFDRQVRRRLQSGLTMVQETLPDIYGMPAEELCALLNAAHERYLAEMKRRSAAGIGATLP